MVGSWVVFCIFNDSDPSVFGTVVIRMRMLELLNLIIA